LPSILKIAIYVKQDGYTVTHAARQRKNGLWTSKLGRSVDIQHTTPESIESDVYGTVAVYMKMPLD
jgi:hypothetical protein